MDIDVVNIVMNYSTRALIVELVSLCGIARHLGLHDSAVDGRFKPFEVRCVVLKQQSYAIF